MHLLLYKAKLTQLFTYGTPCYQAAVQPAVYLPCICRPCICCASAVTTDVLPCVLPCRLPFALRLPLRLLSASAVRLPLACSKPAVQLPSICRPFASRLLSANYPPAHLNR